MKKPAVPGESPAYLRLSLGAAMILGFKSGLFYRSVKLRCVNLLLTYNEGCHANCAYCGLQKSRHGNFNEKSFIRVEWPIYSTTEIVNAVNKNREQVQRICISMITNPRAIEDMKVVLDRIMPLNISTSVLLCPTIAKDDDLQYYEAKGIERIGIAFDLATSALFERLRGKGVKGPHRWNKYENILKSALTIFGPGKVGVHLIVGMGETEKEMVGFMQQIKDLGALPHLFSFFPETNSLLADLHQPSPSPFRRIQLARHLIVHNLSQFEKMTFNQQEMIVSFGIAENLKDDVIAAGLPFLTSGCPHCTRPYGDCMPGEDIRSFPFLPESEDIALIKTQLAGFTSQDS